jgi:hypothetical protein
MPDDEKIIDVGEANEIETEIDLDAPPAPEQSLEEEEVHVEQTTEDSVQPADTAEESAEQSDVQEGEQKSELDEYSEGVNKRIAKLTRRMREAERQKEEAIQYARNIQTEATRVKTNYDRLGGSYAKELEDKVISAKAAAKAELKAAVDSGDVDKQVAAQEAISRVTMEEARLSHVKQAQAAQMAQRQQPQNYAQMAQDMPTQNEIYQAAQQIDPKAEDWSSKNSWFGTDNAMTYTAFDIHRRLVEEEGFNPQSDEYYSEVDKRIRLEFPHKFDTNRDTAADGGQVPTQTVASARRPAAKGRRKTVRLTPSQVAISKRLGVPLEEYAKQLAAKEDIA